MAKRILAALAVGLGLSGPATAELLGELSAARGPRPAERANHLFDTPLTSSGEFARGAIDTTWWGNAANGAHGGPTAIEGGVWDFEGGPLGVLQGWHSVDWTDVEALFGVVPVRRVTSSTFGPEDTDATMNGKGSLWYGVTTAEAHVQCMPGGQGYSNAWGLQASKVFTWGGTGDVTIGIDYFTDSETQFDFSYVYVVNADGTPTPPLNTSVNGAPDTGLGWSGTLGGPGGPLHEDIVVDASVFDGAMSGPAFEVLIRFDSDPLYSDGRDDFAGFLNTVNGPLGCDDIVVSGVDLNDVSDFENGADGWSFFTDPPIGAFQSVRALETLDPVPDPCACPLSGNVMIAADLAGPFAHPKGQNESLRSAPADVSAHQGANRIIRFDIWEDLPTSNGVGFRIALDYFPWTCPTSLVTGWTIEPLDPGGGFAFDATFGGPTCGAFVFDNTVGMPASGLDSIRVVFELLGDCDDFSIVNCTGPLQTNQSPYWDHVRLGATGSGGPQIPLVVDLLYQDAYPRANSLFPIHPAGVHSFYDNNGSDGDPTNANLGDSVVVVSAGPTEGLIETYLNFRVYPGPRADLTHPWFGEYGGDFIADAASGPQDHWAKARMDTAEAGGGSQVFAGVYSSYDWPDGQEHMAISFPASSDRKIIEDGVLTPGTTVEYFFSTNRSITPAQQSFAPDTTDRTYFEFEVLPGYFRATSAGGGPDDLAPCLLYVDAFNGGAQGPIERQALRNLLGQVTDVNGLVHDNWDRYDYLASGTGVCAPLAREVGGDNGMTPYQSTFYKTILYNTGSLQLEGLRDGDAGLLSSFVVSSVTHSSDRGLWLSGDGMARMLDRPSRPQSNLLLGSICRASLSCPGYHEAGCTASAGGDPSACVRLDESPGAEFAQSAPYAASGNGCSALAPFDVLDALGPEGIGNLHYVDQDAGLVETPFTSVSREEVGAFNDFRTVIDGVSVHRLRAGARRLDGYGVRNGLDGRAHPCGRRPVLPERRPVTGHVLQRHH